VTEIPKRSRRQTASGISSKGPDTCRNRHSRSVRRRSRSRQGEELDGISSLVVPATYSQTASERNVERPSSPDSESVRAIRRAGQTVVALVGVRGERGR
jgi:hypothetical protein